ncbi:MAG: DUF4397 domain-containing protein [Rubrivivax sp.]|jgi:hypothetical protein|nr:DUF4397 domain-containing protein [Rubrivivax sp.]
MTLASFSRRGALLACVASSFWLAGCGGSDSGSGSAQIRALNLTGDLASVDIYADDVKTFSAVQTDTLSASVGLDSDSYTLKVKRAGEGSALLTGTYTIAEDQHYTAVVWGRETALRLSTLPEDEDAADITAGNARVRLFNATVDTGTVDVFLTATNVNLADAAATQGSLTSGSLAGYRDISTGTYRLRITGEKNPNDVRLDIPAVTLNEKTFNTIVITAGAGGVLVNGTLIVQQGAVTAFKGNKARVRLAAGVNDAANVSATVGSTTVSGSVSSPRVGGYVLVDAGTADLTVRVNGVATSVTSRTFADGGDYTVLAYGTSAATQVSLLADDNRLPSTTARAKVRLVNGTLGESPMTLSLDYQPLQPSDITVGNASTYYAADSTTATRIEISSLTSTEPLFFTVAATDGKLLQSQGVYTVFMLGGKAASEGVFRRDR